jgi:signal transduction histidine kinase
MIDSSARAENESSMQDLEQMTQSGGAPSCAVSEDKLESISLVSRRIAHDFNNILGGIMGYASFIKSLIEDDSSIYKYVDTIEASATKGADITRLLLDAGRGEPPKRSCISINKVLEKTISELQSKTSEGVEIVTELGEDVPDIYGDEEQLKHMFGNIAENAFEAMPDGGKLTVVSNLSDKFVSVSMTDTGCGISQENTDRIFEPLFSTKANSFVTGFGLPVAYRIVRNHDGMIDFTSTPDQGSTFEIFLPPAR